MNERHKFVLDYLRKKFTFHLSDKNERICLFDKCILNTVEEAFKKAEKYEKQKKEFYDLLDEIENLISKFYKS